MIGYDYVNLLRKYLSYDYVVQVGECKIILLIMNQELSYYNFNCIIVHVNYGSFM